MKTRFCILYPSYLRIAPPAGPHTEALAKTGGEQHGEPYPTFAHRSSTNRAISPTASRASGKCPNRWKA